MKFTKKAVSIIICAVLLFGTVAAGGMIASANDSTSQTGNFIYFGSYPQSEVKDNATVAKLNKTLKAEDWRSYGYYSGTVELPEPTSTWRLRTPDDDSCISYNVHGGGLFQYFGYSAGSTFAGIRPAMQLNLSSGISKSDIILFGSYPQSLVEDEGLIGHLDEANGEWLSYGYYSGTGDSSDGQMISSDYMRYKDVAYNGNKYRAVTFDSYRPDETGYTSSTNHQEENGYFPGNVYWFRYEPLSWRVLDTVKGLVITESVIDSQALNNYLFRKKHEGDGPVGNEESYGDADKTYYACDYANSSIRAWLNDDFINTAFSTTEQNSIEVTELNNNAVSTMSGRKSCEKYDSASTNDKVFLLSYDEVNNTSYFTDSSAWRATSTDYAKCQGVNSYSNYVCDIFCNGEMKPSDFMRYADVTLNGIKYRAVTFDEYRPKFTGEKLGETDEENRQEINGYEKGKVYWFRYDPVKWRVLDPDNGFVLSDIVIDSQPYNNFVVKKAGLENEKYAYFGDEGQTYYASDWAKSSLRTWLNNDFYNTTFTDYQKANIMETVNSNKCYNSLFDKSGDEALNSADTTDKVFLLSYDEIKKEEYGFISERDIIACGSDYALCQGLFKDEESGYSSWHLRSPFEHSGIMCSVNKSGSISDCIYALFNRCDTDETSYGVRPALRLKNLNSEIENTHENTDNFAVGGSSVYEDKNSEWTIIAKSSNPAEDGYKLNGMTLEAPKNDMTNTEMILNAETPEPPAPVFKEQNADYNTDVTINAILRNIPSDAHVYIDGKKSEADNDIYSVNIGQVSSSKDVKVEVKQDENLLDSFTLRVNVDTGILSKLVSFFSNFLFNLFNWEEVTLSF